MTRSKTLLPALGALALLVLAAAMTAAADAPLAPGVRKALDAIRPASPYELVRTMASREFAGRLTGHPGYTAAAKWAAAKFKAWGLRPIDPKTGYLQPYPSPYTQVDKAELALLLPEPAPAPSGTVAFKETKLEILKDFLPLFFTDSGSVTAEAVFAGWGISAPNLNYDDYAGIDAKGKFVLCFRGTPDGSEAFEPFDQHRTRMATARDKGAAGLVYIYAEPASNPNGDRLPGFLPFQVSERAADLILKEKKTSAAGLREALQTYRRPISFPLSAKLVYAVEARHDAAAVGYNVAGYVEGSDPALRRDALVVGGHFDHTGLHCGILFPGANDDASGSAVVMELGRAFAALDRKPRRSVVFVLFGGEEMGLQGSTWFAGHLPAAFAKADGMFNFDMVGEGDGASVWLTADAAPAKAMLEAADGSVRVLRQTGTIGHVGVRSSDFAPFFLKGVPCASFFSNGPHLAYHLPGDTIYRINPDILADIARLAFLTGYAWADR
jgi:hypothetical protein